MRDTTSLKSVLISGTAFAALACATAGPAFAQVHGPEETTPPAATPTGAATPPTTRMPRRTRTRATTSSSPARGSGRTRTTAPCRCRSSPTRKSQRNGISSPEQLLMYLPTNASGAGQSRLQRRRRLRRPARHQRPVLGQSARPGQCRRRSCCSTAAASPPTASSGSAVDVNQIPFCRDRPDRGAEGRRLGDLRHRRDRRRDQLHHPHRL